MSEASAPSRNAPTTQHKTTSKKKVSTLGLCCWLSLDAAYMLKFGNSNGPNKWEVVSMRKEAYAGHMWPVHGQVEWRQ